MGQEHVRSRRKLNQSRTLEKDCRSGMVNGYVIVSWATGPTSSMSLLPIVISPFMSFKNQTEDLYLMVTGNKVLRN